MAGENYNNTQAGTSNGSDIITRTLNPVLNAFGALTNIAAGGLDAYGSFLERKATAKATSQNASAPPSTNTAGVIPGLPNLTNPAALQQIMLYGAAAAFLAFGAMTLFKKVR